jgi:hypothetical protein
MPISLQKVLWACFTLAVLGFGQSCAYDNEEELYPPTGCDTTSITYSSTVQPILDNRCYGCHANAVANVAGAGLSFEGHPNLKQYLDSNEDRFLGAIEHSPGYSPMPKGGSILPDCDLQKIRLWVEQGYPNN